MSWICKQCETVNTDDVLECEVCEAVVPQIKSFSYTEIDVNKPTTFFWESCDCDEVILCYDESEYNVTDDRYFELLITKSSTITFRVINSATTKLFSFPVYVSLPKIKEFSADKLCVLEGAKIRLQWDVVNSEVVNIDVLGNQNSKGSKLILATKNAFKIIAENSTGSISKELNVDILKKPIVNLKLSKSKLRKNSSEKAALKWNIQNAISAKLIVDGEERIIDVSGNEEVAPAKTTVYEIHVVGLDGITVFKKLVTLYVLADTQIEFNTSRLYTYPKIPFVLSWNVQHAKSVELIGYGIVEESGSKIIEIEHDTTFILKVIGSFGVKTEEILVKTLPLPVIKTLLVPAPEIKHQTTVNLNLTQIQPMVSMPTNLYTHISIPSLVEPDFAKLEVEMHKPPKFHSLNIDLKSINWWNNIWNRIRSIKGFKF